MLHDRHDSYRGRAVQVTHACGHTTTHLVPEQLAPDRLLRPLTDSMVSSPCPACLEGVPAWAIDPVIRDRGASDTGVS
jgi:hypothetical protein